MTDLDTTGIRDAFERDLQGYRAPPGLAGRARNEGRRRARRRRLEVFAGLAMAAAAAAIAVFVWPVGGLPAATAAPFTVTRGPHGTVVISSREFLTRAQGAQLQGKLRAEGVPVNVIEGSGNEESRQQCKTAGFPDPRGMASRVFVSSRFEGGWIVLIIRPAALLPGVGIRLSGGEYTNIYAPKSENLDRESHKPISRPRRLGPPRGGDGASMEGLTPISSSSLGWGFVKASPACTGT
jgi:hypothetical protein